MDYQRQVEAIIRKHQGNTGIIYRETRDKINAEVSALVGLDTIQKEAKQLDSKIVELKQNESLKKIYAQLADIEIKLRELDTNNDVSREEYKTSLREQLQNEYKTIRKSSKELQEVEMLEKQHLGLEHKIRRLVNQYGIR